MSRGNAERAGWLVAAKSPRWPMARKAVREGLRHGPPVAGLVKGRTARVAGKRTARELLWTAAGWWSGKMSWTLRGGAKAICRGVGRGWQPPTGRETGVTGRYGLETGYCSHDRDRLPGSSPGNGKAPVSGIRAGTRAEGSTGTRAAGS